MSKKILRTIIIDELDQGYKVTTDTRGGCTLDTPEVERKYRQELAVPNLGKTMKIVKDYLLPDIEADTEVNKDVPVELVSGSKEISPKKRGA